MAMQKMPYEKRWAINKISGKKHITLELGRRRVYQTPLLGVHRNSGGGPFEVVL